MGLRNYLGNLLLKAAQEAKEQQEDKLERAHRNTLGRGFGGVEDHLQSASPAILAYRIANGFIVRTLRHEGEISKIYYCENLQAVSEHLVAEQTKDALGLRTSYQEESVAKEAYGARSMAIQGNAAQAKQRNFY
jgi:hypothetical protein